ncbi:hypothetical protein D5W64_12330 [Salmonella enterica subsp. enterica serovar Saintpaul]|nr:hypothetical protein [Salmonella enterica subsp. enterica serovar Saintpaul]
MASDNFDMDWGDDPFGGDIDFDMDFNMDPFKGKGFVSSFATGFLSGVVDETVGSGEARMRSIRTILPGTWANALDKVSFVSSRIDELVQEFKEENSESVKSLQTIASHLNQKMGDKLPGFMSNAIGNFSSKDFSDWEKLDDGTNKRFTDKMGRVSESDVDQIMDTAASTQSSMFASLGESLNSMTAAATGSVIATIGAGNRQLVNIEGGIRDLLNYQRNVQAKLDQAQLNLTARAYVQDAKFYKFMEAGVHQEIKELKSILHYAKMSDFQKTSTYTASKDYLRKRGFQAIGKRIGGLTGALSERFSEGNRKEAYGIFGDLLGNIADGLDMGGDVTFSRGLIGNILGKQFGALAVDEMPYFFTRGPGKKMVDNLMKKFPSQGEYIKQKVAEIEDMGNVASHVAMGGGGIANYMADNWEMVNEERFYDYEEYVDSLPPGKKPIPKAAWVVKNAAENRAKQSLNRLMSETSRSRGTQYTISRRNPKDLDKPGVWKEMNNITLNEVLPGLISQTNLILEKMRTGKDDIERVSYNYTRGEFQSDSDRRVSVKADLMPHGEFKSFTKAALNMVDSMDPGGLLSDGARKAFAKQIIVDIDKGYGFQPLYYMGDIPGMSPAHLEEVHNLMKHHFGITDTDVADFKAGDSFTKTKMLGKLNTEEGRARLNDASSMAQDLKQNIPNIQERINLLRNTGNEQMLRDIGVIYTDNGIDKINIQAYHDRIGQYMDNPDNPVLRGATQGSSSSALGTKGGLPSGSSINAGSGAENPYESLNATLGTLNQRLETLGNKESMNAGTMNWDPVTGALTELKTSSDGIFTNTTAMNALLTEMLELAKKGQLVSGAPSSPTEARKEEQAKKSLLDRFRSIIPTDVMGKGIDVLMKNNPLILGTLLGGVASGFATNPLMAASLAGLGVMGGAYIQWRNRTNKGPEGSTGDMPSDDEDILDEQGEPILKASKLNMGDYIDIASKKVIKTWGDIKGPIMDKVTKAVIGAKELAGKIFGPDGRAVALKGLTAVRDAAVGTYNFLDPINRMKSVLDSGKELIYQQDVYLKSDLKNPVLRAVKFKTGDYFIRDNSGNFTPINGWNEINGAVYDNEGNQLVSEDEYHAGLVTSTGAVVRNVGAGTANFIGGAAGLAKAGVNALLSRFGYSNTAGQGPGAVGHAGGKRGNSSSGVERRLDRIYHLLCTQFDIPPEGMDGEANFTGEKVGGGLRLNSLAWKEKQAEKAEKEKVNKAIINISENMSGGDDKGPGEKKEGWFDKIKGLAMGAGSFAMNLLKNPLGAIGGLLLGAGKMVLGSGVASLGRLAKIGTTLFSGVLGVTSPIFNLLKTGFIKLAQVFALGKGARMAGDLMDGLGDGDVNQRGQSAKKKKGEKGSKGRTAKTARTKSGRFGKLKGLGRGLLGSPLSMAATAGGAYLLGGFDEDAPDASLTQSSDVGIGERDPVTGHYRTGGDAAVDALTSYLPSGMLAKAGMDAVGGETRSTLENYGMFWASDGKFFFRRNEVEEYEDQLQGINRNPEGYGELKKVDETPQRAVRLAMYGVKDQGSALGRRIGWLEQVLYPYVAIRNGRASFKENMPIEKILTDFIRTSGGTAVEAPQVKAWFSGRFKPIFLTFNAVVSAANMGDLEEFDRASGYIVVQSLERVQQGLGTIQPYPYTFAPQIDIRTGLMDESQTTARVNALMVELNKLYKNPAEGVDTKMRGETPQEVAKSELSTSTLGHTQENSAQSKMGQEAARASREDVERRFSQPEQVKTIDVSDMLPKDGTAIDAFTMTRLAVYGNVDNMPWRCEAVLRLERYMESYIMVIGEQTKFTGKSAHMLEIFRASFRISKPNEEMNWLTWFRDRFLPTCMLYVKEVKKYRGTSPEKGWRGLSATNQYDIARLLMDQIVTVDDNAISIWEVQVGPFPNSKSGTFTDRADKYMKILDSKATEARLKDPEMEAEKSRGVQGDDQNQSANQQRMNELTRMAVDKQLASNSSTSGGAFQPSGLGAGGGSAAGGVYPNATMSLPGGGAGSAGSFMGKADENFNPEYLKKAGDDKGIKMSPEQGEKLMLNHLLKAGITDIKTIALALAMTKKETGNYQNTVEDTRWSAPTLLKYFKNIPDAATAQKVAAMSPPERAMWVYGRNPKAKGLGNTKPEDGWDYRGRGFFQLTGKANYERFKKETGIDVVSNPRLVSEDPNVMAESAVRFLKNSPAMMSIAKTGDFDTAVRGINGGNAVPATDERRKYYQEYLNKLRNGDLSLDSTEAAAGADQTAAAVTPGAPEEVPAAADQNVPKDQIAESPTSPNSPTPPASPASEAKSLLADDAQRAVPTNTAASPETNRTASPMDPANVNSSENESVPPAVNQSTPAPSQTVNNSGSSVPTSSVPGSASAATAPTAVPPPVQQPAPEAPKAPEHIQSTDVAAVNQLATANQTLNRIASILERQGQRQPSVTV